MSLYGLKLSLYGLKLSLYGLKLSLYGLKLYHEQRQGNSCGLQLHLQHAAGMCCQAAKVYWDLRVKTSTSDSKLINQSKN